MRKLVAIVLALVMVLSLGTVAFAVEDDPKPTEVTYTDQTTVTVTKSYKLIGAGTSPAETFTLKQVGDGVVQDGEATAAPALGTITGATFAEGAATKTGATANVTITLPRYSSVGVYAYNLQEVAGTTAGVSYYGDLIRLIVTVINDATGNIRIAAVHTESANDRTKSDVFENTYSAGALNVTKTVTGNLGDKDKYFEFTVTLIGESNQDYGDAYAVTGGSKIEDGATTCAASSISIGTAKKFYLKHGETISIANLPYGVSYTVVETSCADDGYTTEKTGDTGTIGAAEQTAAFTNNKQTNVDTGIGLDSLPYIMLLGFAVVALGAAALRKRMGTNR